MSSTNDEPGTGNTEGERPTYASDVALADNADSLDPEHEINVWARDNGLGLVPNVMKTDEAKKYAIVGLGAIMAITAIPLGWHIIDDGKRVLVFDEVSAVQVEMSLADAGELTPEEILQSVLTQMQAQVPGVQHILLELAGMPTIGFRGVKAPNGAAVDQAFMFKPCPVKKGMLAQVRVTAVPERMVQAMNLAEVLTRELKWMGE
ncbi:MAG: hypothetical protein WD768_08820 [Phycisphaeraceae bacterium]